MLLLYQMKLLSYYNLSLETWSIIGLSFFSFSMGIILVYTARSIFSKQKRVRFKSANELIIFSDGGKTLKYAIIILGTIGILASIQHWLILIKMFGSIPAVIINANIVYRLRVERHIQGVIPYLYIFSYIAVFFAGLYAAYNKKISLIVVFPFLGVILEDLANVGRSGILFSLIEFLSVYVFSSNILNVKKAKKNNKIKLVVGILLILSLLVVSASLIRSIRHTYEVYQGESHKLTELRGGFILTPSIYLYLTADVGVLNKFLQFNNERTSFGENTFLTLYSILSKFDLIKRPSDYQKGYYIPMWTNTGTYLRELYADFGILGILIGPFLIGVFATFFWFRSYESSSIMNLILLVFIFLIIGFSFLVMVTRLATWSMGIVMLLILSPIMEKISKRSKRKFDLLKS